MSGDDAITNDTTNVMTNTTNVAPPPLDVLAGRIRQSWPLRTTVQRAREIGELLLQAKWRVRHGEWLPWLAANVPFSARTAQKYMRLASRWPEIEAAALKRAASEIVLDAMLDGVLAWLDEFPISGEGPRSS